MIGGSGAGHAVPEALIVALEARYLKEGFPRQITLLHPVGIGDNVSQGVGHLAHTGLVKRIVAGALVNSPAFQKLAVENKVEAYTLPQGSLSELTRETAGRRSVDQTGLHTFVDPRISGKTKRVCEGRSG
jgi:propionate CoA-transferase